MLTARCSILAKKVASKVYCMLGSDWKIRITENYIWVRFLKLFVVQKHLVVEGLVIDQKDETIHLSLIG